MHLLELCHVISKTGNNQNKHLVCMAKTNYLICFHLLFYSSYLHAKIEISIDKAFSSIFVLNYHFIMDKNEWLPVLKFNKSLKIENNFSI